MSRSIKRDALTVADFYTETLEEVLGLELDADSLRRKDVRHKLEPLAREIAALGTGFTSERERFVGTHYLSNPDIRRAYQLYYTTTNFLKIVPPLRELALSGFFERPVLRVLDLGTGTGAALWGLFQFCETELSAAPAIEIVAVDTVPENLRQTKRFHQAIAKRLNDIDSSIETKTVDLQQSELRAIGSVKYDLVLMMNTLNEMSADAEQRMLASLPDILHDGGTAIVIEPASREESRRLLRFRDSAVQYGFTIYAPCTRQAGCPAILDKHDWCHAEYRWDRPSYIRIIDDLVGTLRLSLKCSYVTINKSGRTLPSVLGSHEDLSRVVSERFDEKGRIRAICCNTGGRCEYVLNKRDIADSNREFKDTERYDTIEIDFFEEREHDRRITEASKVHNMLRNTGAR